MDYFQYWGKARPEATDGEPYHLLPFHCLDVAAVADALWQRDGLLRASFARMLGLDETRARALLIFLIACHDLGKFADGFQQLAGTARAALQPGRAPLKGGYLRHDALGRLFWWEVLVERAASQLGAELAKTLEPLVVAVTGHHGMPTHMPEHHQLKQHFDCQDQQAAVAFVDGVLALFPLDLEGDAFGFRALERCSLFVAGLTMICDWAGSHQAYFPYCSERELGLAAYWSRACAQARVMLTEVQLLPPPVARETGMALLFPNYQPTLLQAAADGCVLDPGPQLFIIEDLTGAGKTEAAMVLAHKLMHAGSAHGLFIGLPTMATADQMYARVADCYGRFYEDKPFLMLAHSARKANPRFLSQLGLEAEHAVVALGDGALDPAESAAPNWLADNAKKSLLAAIGVGTVDQVLLAVLRQRHACMRLFGLMGKVLIVDELHAYDAYMQTLLEEVLALHTRQGGSTILLSATLQTQQRLRLIQRFQRSLGLKPQTAVAGAYPLFTQVGATGAPALEREVPGPERTVVLRFVDEAPLALIRQWADAGQCVCWLRNTVSDALAAYEALSSENTGLDCLLFHARFALVDRLRIQDEVLLRFGKHSRAADRAGRILIATQVIEQSLDVDFDRLVTDLAPIDLILQRDGRQMRHRRDAVGNPLGPDQADERGAHELTVFAPTWSDEPEARWYADAFPGGAAVYKDHDHLLWLTQRILREQGGFTLPRDARTLVDGVYGATDVPASFQNKEQNYQGQQYAAQAMAHGVDYHAEEGYVPGLELDGQSEDAVRVSTRLGLNQITFHLAIWEDEVLRPYAQGRVAPDQAQPSQLWFQSQVRLPGHWCQGRAVDAVVAESELKRLERTLPGHLMILPLRPHGTRFQGAVRDQERTMTFIYDPVLGALKPQAVAG